MSKPISFGFGKPKAPANAPSKPPTSISLPTKKPTSSIKPDGFKSRSALPADDDDDRDDEVPKHEEVTGFSSSGVILSKPVEEKKAIVIENQGNGDWRRRGRGRQETTQDRNGAASKDQDVVMVEKDEVSKASGLQLAPVREPGATDSTTSEAGTTANGHQEHKPKTADEEALQALLSDDPNAPRGNTIIAASENQQLRPADELAGFRSDVASRPDVATLDDYAAMPVEEFGLAMLRGMGKKRRANGEVINVEPQPEKDKKEVKKAKHEGFLGIGAKPAPGLEGVELGAWGKADMRRNNKGQGFFTPVMVKDRETGETITEEELERRKKKQDGQSKGEEDWRERRDKNLEKNGTRRIADSEYKDAMNDFSRKKRDEDSGHESSRSRRDRDSDYDASRSKRHRSRSRERRYKDDDRIESSSSRRDKDRDYDRDRDRHRERHKDRDRDRDRDRDDRRYRDRR